MVWSDAENEYMYFPKEARFYEHSLVETELKAGMASGKITITNIADESAYEFMVHEANVDGEEGTLLFQCVEVATSTRCTILIQRVGDYRQVSVFMPDERLVVFLDNFPNE